VMQSLLKRISGKILIPITRWYLRKDRAFRYENFEIKILAGVFHPGLFPSTGFILSFLKEQNLKDQSLLELGCGTGLISVVAAHLGATVTAIDLSLKAVENCKLNSNNNDAPVEVFQSDLFKDIPAKKFDWIVINPPYYPRKPIREDDLAWLCGPNFEYFRELFSQLTEYIHAKSQVIMVLTKNLDIKMIQSIAQSFDFAFEKIREQDVLFDEKDFLFRISKSNLSATSKD